MFINNTVKKLLKIFLIGLFVNLLVWSQAMAIPILQLYIEGSTYDESTETWQADSANFTLWVIGDVSKFGDINDVMLSVAYDSSETGTVTLTPTTADTGYLPVGGVDTSLPVTPAFLSSGNDNAPLMGNGSPLPSHGIYGSGVSWTSYSLGDLTLTDSLIQDYFGDVPGTATKGKGQINAYEVDITGYSWVHFDTFGNYESGKGNGNGKHTNFVKAPFSHDSEWLSEPIPEPATIALLGIGLVGLAGGAVRRRFKKNRVGSLQ